MMNVICQGLKVKCRLPNKHYLGSCLDFVATIKSLKQETVHDGHLTETIQELTIDFLSPISHSVGQVL